MRGNDIDDTPTELAQLTCQGLEELQTLRVGLSLNCSQGEMLSVSEGLVLAEQKFEFKILAFVGEQIPGFGFADRFAGGRFRGGKSFVLQVQPCIRESI